MKYTKKIKNLNEYDFNKLYQFQELHKSNIPKFSSNENSKYNQRNISYNNEIEYTDKNININKNIIDKYSNEKLLKEISEIKEKIKKYQNELSRAKRERNAQNIYISLLERKYVSKLISKNENICYKSFKNENNSNKTFLINKEKEKEKFNESIKPNKLIINDDNNNKLHNDDNFNYKNFKQKLIENNIIIL